jgi:hypothetical protein
MTSKVMKDNFYKMRRSGNKVYYVYLRLHSFIVQLSTTEELLGRKISGSGLESEEYCRRDP